MKSLLYHTMLHHQLNTTNATLPTQRGHRSNVLKHLYFQLEKIVIISMFEEEFVIEHIVNLRQSNRQN